MERTIRDSPGGHPPEPVEEAIFFHEKLREAGMPFGALVVVTRVHHDEHPATSLEEVTAALCEPLGGQPTAVAQDLAAFRALAARDARALDRLRTRLAVIDPVLVGQPDGDVHDVAGLGAIHRHL